MPSHQPEEDGTTASVYHFFYEFVPIHSDSSQYSELSATTFSQCSATNRISFSSTTVEILLCLTYLLDEYCLPAHRNCLGESDLLPEAPQASF